MASADRAVTNMVGAAALPRRNGELVFESPWEGRAFGMAVALGDTRLYDWEEFRQGLIAEIAASEVHGEAASYYEQWLAAFERLLIEKGALQPDEIERRVGEFESGARDEVY